MDLETKVKVLEEENEKLKAALKEVSFSLKIRNFHKFFKS